MELPCNRATTPHVFPLRVRPCGFLLPYLLYRAMCLTSIVGNESHFSLIAAFAWRTMAIGGQRIWLQTWMPLETKDEGANIRD